MACPFFFSFLFHFGKILIWQFMVTDPRIADPTVRRLLESGKLPAFSLARSIAPGEGAGPTRGKRKRRRLGVARAQPV